MPKKTEQDSHFPPKKEGAAESGFRPRFYESVHSSRGLAKNEGVKQIQLNRKPQLEKRGLPGEGRGTEEKEEEESKD